MLWLIQRDFLQGKTVGAMVAEALASQPNPHGDKDIDQVPLIRQSFAFQLCLSTCAFEISVAAQPTRQGHRPGAHFRVSCYGFENDGAAQSAWQQGRHQVQRRCAAQAPASTQRLRQHLQRLRQHLPCGDSGWPKGPSTGETRRQLPAANWLTLDDPPHGSLLRLRPRAGEPHQAVAVADSAQQHRLRAGAAAPGAHQAVSAGGLGAGPALRGPAGGAAAAGHQSGAPQGRLQVPEVPAPPQSHFAEWKNSARRWTSTTWPSWTSCSSSSPAWRTPRWGMFVGFGLFVCLLAFVTLSQPFDPSGSCSMALPASKNTWCLPMSGWLRLFSGGARVGWSFHLCPMPRQQCCQLQCR